MTRKRVYMDFASSTPLHKDVWRDMRSVFRTFGNPSAPHAEGRNARECLENARVRIARVLSAKPETLYFTGGGTEANNLAISGIILAFLSRGARLSDLHVIASVFEHPSVDEPLVFWEQQGLAVTRVTPDGEGIISLETVLKALRPETVLVSIVAVQSELGTVEPLKDIARALEMAAYNSLLKHDTLVPECRLPILHSDASQGSLFLDLSPERLGAKLVTYDAQKIMGPKGIGVLYRHSSVPILPIIRGGSQERNVRPGTENPPLAVGMARAFELAATNRKKRAEKVSAVRDYFIDLLEKELPDAEVNGSLTHRIANNIHISIQNADSDYLAVLLDKEGIAVSPRSSCIASGSSSRAVEALGKPEGAARGTLRFTLSPDVTKADAHRAIAALKKALSVVM